MTGTTPTQPSVSDPTVAALANLIARMERQEEALSDLIVESDDPANTARLETKRAGLRLGLTDAREEFALAVSHAAGSESHAAYADLVADASVPLVNYSAALDEIYTLRRAAAYEASVVASHLEYKSFPKSRRSVADEQVERLRLAARGHAQYAYSGKASQVMRHCLREAGASETMTRHEFETGRGLA